jgi:cyclic beta-1,2-glucan synthetase
MGSVDEHLVQRQDGLIRLLTPPFEYGESEPGYIKGYGPGIRENGGQYTHAAAWVIMAFAALGDGDQATELFDLINPINHTRNYREYSHYKLEPYVMAADVYSVHPHIGRGGWSWYTGSAGWIYQAGLYSILGFSKSSGNLVINPCIPGRWKEYSIDYHFQSTCYHIQVVNPEGVMTGIRSVSMDGIQLAEHVIPLVDDHKKHDVLVTMGVVQA